jgi:hypothetical protein
MMKGIDDNARIKLIRYRHIERL